MERSATSELAWIRGLCRTGEARQVRRSVGVRLAEIAAECRTTASHVSKWELGRQQPRGDSGLAYAAVIRRLRRRATDVEVAG